MASGKIYLREGDGLVPMAEARYDAEDVLQALLADYPDLLAGDQMRPEEPRRWLLVTREAGIPDRDGGGARWSIDHLFIDQDAVPTLVEVKRSTDTRIRREVVGQMLDYAANVVAYWAGGQLRELFEGRERASGPPTGQAAAACGQRWRTQGRAKCRRSSTSSAASMRRWSTSTIRPLDSATGRPVSSRWSNSMGVSRRRTACSPPTKSKTGWASCSCSGAST